MAQGEFAELVDGVVADAEVVAGGGGGAGFGQCGVGLGWCAAFGQGAVGAVRCCRVAEGVEQGLQLGDGRRGGVVAVEPAFEGLVEAFDFALGLRVAGVAVFLGDAQAGQEAFEVVVAVGES